MVEDRWWTSLSRGILGGIWFSFAKAMEDFIDGLGNYGYVLYRQICEKGYHRGRNLLPRPALATWCLVLAAKSVDSVSSESWAVAAWVQST
jgi:hypothetical protein